MRTERRRSVWPSRLPVVDPAFRESVIRSTARNPRTFGFALARLRAARGWSLTTQAMALGIFSEDALIFLSVFRLPDAEYHAEDLVRVAKCLGLREQVLDDLLAMTPR